jgi:hypothetical protein
LEDLDIAENIKNIVKNTKTPLRIPQDVVNKDELTVFEISPYKRKYEEDNELLETDLNVNAIKEFFLHVELGLEALSTAYVDTASDVRLVKVTLEKDHRTLLSRIQDLEGTIGKRARLEQKYQAPTLWGSVSLLASSIDDLSYSVLHQVLHHVEARENALKGSLSQDWELGCTEKTTG